MSRNKGTETTINKNVQHLLRVGRTPLLTGVRQTNTITRSTSVHHDSNQSTSVDQSLSQQVLPYAEGLRNQVLESRLDQIEESIRKIHKDQEQFCKELPDRVGKVVGLYVVGDSWFRWDSTHSYYPTLCFKFKEVNCEKYPRTSQIKIKLKGNNQDLTDADIRALREAVERLGDLTYHYGSNRGYFIAKNRRFKTTVYGDSREDIEKVLSACLSVAEEEFDPNDLSYTGGNNRANVVKRKQPLSNVAENPVDYKSASKQQLFRVLLMVNGLASPIVIKE